MRLKERSKKRRLQASELKAHNNIINQPIIYIEFNGNKRNIESLTSSS